MLAQNTWPPAFHQVSVPWFSAFVITFLLHFLFPILFTHSSFSKNDSPRPISCVHLTLSHPNSWLCCPLHLLWLNPTFPSRPIFPPHSLSFPLTQLREFPKCFLQTSCVACPSPVGRVRPVYRHFLSGASTVSFLPAPTRTNRKPAGFEVWRPWFQTRALASTGPLT